jgi:hypothetical protein
MVRVQNGPLNVALAANAGRAPGSTPKPEWTGEPGAAEHYPPGSTGTLNGPPRSPIPSRSGPDLRAVPSMGSGGPPVRVVTENGPFRFAVR